MQSIRSHPTTDHYRPDIDGLRAFAVLSVVLYHAFPKTLRGGYVGVDIFFVISGFLISSILFKEFRENRFSFLLFYERRIRRIFPALTVCLAAVLAYGFVSLMPFELAELGKHVFFGAGFLSNIALWNETGYFDGASGLKPLLHLWSLGVEEQFYIFWPGLLWILFRIKAPVGLLLVVLFLVSFAINIALSLSHISADFYLPFSRFWEFLAGAGLAWRRDSSLTLNWRRWISWAGFAALVASVTLFTTDFVFPGWPALLPVAGAVAVILSGPSAQANRIIFSNRIAVFIGLISYPLYLWHWPLISFAHVVRMEKPLTPLLAVALVTASFLLAWATHRFVEFPIRYGANRHRRTQVVAACMAVLGVCGFVVWINKGFPERFPAYPGDLDIRKISAAKLDPIYGPTKGMDVADSDGIIVSHLGKGEKKVALAGDSLVLHYGPRVQQLSDEGMLAANTYFVTLPSCAPVPEISHGNHTECARLPRILAELVRREKIQSVVLGANWGGYSGENTFVQRASKRLPLNTEEGKDAFYSNLKDFVRALQNDGAKVYLVLGSPIGNPGLNPRDMVTRNMLGFHIAADFDKGLPIAALRAKYPDADANLHDLAARTGAIILDPFPDICGNGLNCSPLFNYGEPKFSDGMHLRPAFVRQHLHFLDALLK